jgi:transglutaminase-like putative cysteine protease
VELPTASSFLEARSRPPEPRGRARRLLAVSAAALVLAGIGGCLALGLGSKPRLERLTPSVGEPGSLVVIEGRNFGASRGDSRVEVDGVVPTASSYASWSEGSVSVRLPASVDSGLVYVITRGGKSNALLFMNRARLPVPAAGTKEGRSGPYVASLSPEDGRVGSLVALTGLDFGASRESSSVLFAWSAEYEGGPSSGDQAVPQSVSPSEADLGYESWSDKEIRVRVPDGAVSGPVYVVTGEGRSNAAFIRVSEGPGTKRYSSRSSYSLAAEVSVTKVKASGANELYLWVPLPVSSSSQRLVRVLERDPPPLVPDYRGTALYRFANLASGRSLSVTQSFLVQSFATEASVDPRAACVPQRDPPALAAAYTAADALVPASAPEIKDIVKKAAGAERGTWRAARLVWDWLGRNLSWTDRHAHERPLDALKDRSADSYSYAIVACALLRAAGVPTLPVAGYLVDPSRKAVRHWWLEAYVYGLGWVPLDPALAAGASPGGLRPAWEDRTRYFGGVDGRRVAFSRGLTVLAPMTSGGRRVSKERLWSFQSFYEEASGALDAYSSLWGDVAVTGMY